MKIRKITAILMIGFVLLACGPAQLFSPTATPTPPPTPTPIPTATPDPIKSIDLEELLKNAGDMPLNCTGGEISRKPSWSSDYMAKFPDADNSIYQSILCSGDEVGGVTIFLYQNSADLDKAYNSLKKDTLVEDIGEQASANAACGYVVNPSKGTSGFACWARLAFTQCSAVVNISLSDIEDAKSGAQFTYTYAQQLEEALSAQVCLNQ